MGTALRMATREDTEFVVQTERETMRAYAVATWGAWREAEARKRAVDNLLAGRTQIIERGSVPVGILRVERTAECMNLKQIFIRPEFQRRGIGGELLRRLIDESRAARVPLRLRVLKVNPAQELYGRLGFTVAGTGPHHVYMECAP